ncbi:MAG: DUF1501 domain-containing protein [Planctomycetaceae bacterium]
MTPPPSDLIRIGSRRWFLQTGLAALGGLTLPQLLHARELAAASNANGGRKAVILFWLSGGPSQLDMWDPKPGAPVEVRGPFAPISTALSGVQFSEHLPLQASIADKLSIIRSVDCTASNHTPITLQAGNPLARRTNDGRDGAGYPSMGSIAAKFRGANDPELPAFVGLADSWAADVYGAGQMGSQYEPVKGLELAGKFNLPEGVEVPRLGDRNDLRQQLDGLRRGLDQHQTLDKVDRYTQQAYDMVLSGRVQQAFNLDDETDATRRVRARRGRREGTRTTAGRGGVTFVLVSGALRVTDHHGDDVRWGGIGESGLKPPPPRRPALYALINDSNNAGLLDDTFVMMMGEFGRTP